MKKAFLLTAGLALALGSTNATAADVEAGKKVFKKCKACHSLKPGKKKVGPSLHDVVGNKAGQFKGFKYSKAMKKAFVVTLASHESETTHESNLVLPTLTAYESWGDAFPRIGVSSIQQPVMAPVNNFNARAREDILLNVAKKVNGNSFLRISSYMDYLKQIWQK